MTINSALTAAAMQQSTNLANNNSTGDYHVANDGSTPRSRARDAGYTGWVGENVVYAESPQDAFNWWLGSSIHYSNMTNRHWKDIGVGVASGPNGTWYTLVFGTLSWDILPASPSACGGFAAVASSDPSVVNTSSDTSTNGSTNENARPAPIVLGVDEHGNIQHQIQAGDTVGDIAIMYGYSWDDIPALLALNNMTESDIRSLKVGEVFLVPPQTGTFTPVPGQASPTSLPAEAQTTTTNLPVTTSTSTPTPSPTLLPPTATMTPIVIAALPSLSIAVTVDVPLAASSVLFKAPAKRETSRSFPLMKMLLGLQILVLIGVAVGYFRHWIGKS
ncbi:MAG: LysM peptidoglycan-binding domain-containing protein [Chloroflexi bacterium]|nr:LysM peptidoglycan-binding domain-containing protein [Chloroflexota bacterium]